MHIYIRTGDNENTGIEFLNGKGWEISGYERKGFNYTPPAGDTRRYVFKEGFKSKVLPFLGGEKALAAMVLAVEELRSVDGEQEIKTVTWIREGHDKIRNLLKMLGLNGSTWTAEPLRDEIQHIIYTYMNKVLNQVEVSITDEDRKRITYDNNENQDIFGYMKEDEPQGFSITFDETVEHYTIPEFLRHAVFTLTDEQKTLAEAILLADKLSKLEPGELVTSTLKNFMGEIKEPTPAGEVLERLQHFICAYTVNDDSKIIVIDGSKTDEDRYVRKVAVTTEILKRIDFHNAPGLSAKPDKLSDFNAVRSMDTVGFTVTDVYGRLWLFSATSRGDRSVIYAKSYEDRALAVAALATLREADKHQYYGRLQVVSDVLDVRFVDAVNDILQGRDYYELVGYLKRLFNVEEVRR